MNNLLENLNTPGEVWTAFAIMSSLSGVAVAFLGWLIWKVVDYFRTWVVWWDEDSGRVEIERRKVKQDTLTRGKGKEGRMYFLNARARKTANKGSAYFIDVHTGMNLTGLSRIQTREILRAAGIELAGAAGLTPPVNGHATPENLTKYERFVRAVQLKLEACDPSFVFNKAKTNSFAKFFRSREGEEDWRTKIAPYALGGLAMAVVGLIWLANAYQKTQGA